MAVAGFGSHRAVVASPAVAEAVSLVIGGGVSSSDPAILAIAGRISPAAFMTGNLSGDSGFRALVLAQPEVQRLLNPAQYQQLLREQQQSGPGALLRYAAWRDDTYSVISSTDYGGSLVSDDRITSGNYGNSRFGPRGAGIPEGVYNELLGQGYSRDQIYGAGRQADLLGWRGDQRMIRNQALIQRYDNNVEATNRAFLNLRRAADGDQELASIRERLATATGEERTRLLEQFNRRWDHLSEREGVTGRLTDPENHEGARRGIRGGKEQMREHYRQFGRSSPHLSDNQVLDLRAGVRASLDVRQQVVAVQERVQPQQTVEVDLLAAGGLPTPATVQRVDAPVRPAPGSTVIARDNTAQSSGPKLA